jgi:hypothetical protein
MRESVVVLFSVLLGSIAGCGDSKSAAPAKASPSGSTLVSLPGDRGCFEIKTEFEPAPRGARGAGRSAKILASFYQADGTTPMSPLPTEVSVMVGSADSGKTIALSPIGDTSKSKSPLQFSSAAGDYPETLRGTLSATVNGEKLEAPFTAR